MKIFRILLTNRKIGAVSQADGIGSKSISNRMLLLPLLLSNPITISHLLESEDTEIMASSLRRLGITAQYDGRELKLVKGGGSSRHQHFFLCNSGTSARFLTSTLCASKGNYFLRGSNRMHKRPFRGLIESLRALGATVSCQSAQHSMPIIVGTASTAPSFGTIRLTGNTSSQFITAVLFSILLKLQLGTGPVAVNIGGQLTSKPYVSMTIAMIEMLGSVVERSGWRRLTVLRPLSAHHKHPVLAVETDMTSVSYFAVLTIASVGGIKICGTTTFSLQGDAFFISVLIKNNCWALFADDGFILLGARTKPRPLELDCNLIPDVAMTALITSAFSLEAFYCNNILSWRFKETDRILAMSVELRKAGLVVESSLTAVRSQRLPEEKSNATITLNTYNDHRMAMCFSVVCLIGLNLRVTNPFCVNKTFSNYFHIFNNLVGSV